ncbi:lamin tail domain-containing protein [Wenzhouxiangella sp. EGI_FJ10409]|uniref:lamin tail domain-containing protein n=1 Tax=Wenzhouxiangella sp. EGI_FJ10409 TaxID=3243767 RepID=UPI0035D9B3CC
MHIRYLHQRLPWRSTFAFSTLILLTCPAWGELPAGQNLVLSEVFYDAAGPDDQLEWVELYNRGNTTIMLTGNYSLGWGGTTYTYGTLDLVGSIGPGETFVVGGPMSSSSNYSPALGQAQDFDPDIQNSGITADGVALFDLPAASLTASTVPVDAVIYGGQNDSQLIDHTGQAPSPNVGDAVGGESIARNAAGWFIQPLPTPNQQEFILFADRFED